MRMRALALLGVGAALAVVPATASAQLPSTTDPRASLAQGLDNAGVAQKGMELLAHRGKPPGWSNPTNPGDFGFVNSDLAFQGDYAFVGGFNGIQIWNIANPSAPTLTTALLCPGGQGDVSVYKNLLFMSTEGGGRVNCGPTPAENPSPVFLGVRIFDISNIEAPVQVGGVQTCRGSHTHTLVRPKNDAATSTSTCRAPPHRATQPRSQAVTATTPTRRRARTRRSGGSRSSRCRSPHRRQRRS